MDFSKKATANKQKKITSRASLFGGKLKVIVLRLLIVAVLAAVAGGVYLGVGIVKDVINDAPSITVADVKPSGYTTFVYDQNGTELVRFVAANANRIWKSIDDIPEVTQHAFVAIEDSRFYEHSGIDLQGIARAAAVGIAKGGHFSEGASTITQQLIKNTVFPEFMNEETFKESLTRKIQEQYLALKLEQTMSKSEIMENYLNTINLGQNSLGIQTASKRYFNKDCSELNLSESAVIAAITQNPSKYNPISHPEANAERRRKVLNDMLEQEWITQEEYTEAMNDDVYARIQVTNAAIEEVNQTVYSYYVDELISQVIQDLQDMKGYTYTQAYNALYSGGLTIYACQDLEIQQIVDEEMAAGYNYPDELYYGISYAATITRVNGDVENYYTETLLSHMRSKYGDGYSILYDYPEEAYAAMEEYRNDLMTPGDTIVESYSVMPEPQASVVIMDQYTGEVKAISGGRGEKTASLTLNRATDTTRQPGSCFKVLSTYAPAIDACGYTLATSIEDEQFFYDSGREVKNWYQGFLGTVTVRKAIEQSMNVCAVKTLTEITPQLGFDYLLNFGFTTLVDRLELADGSVLSDIVQPLALGGITNGITNLEITAAYAALANKGLYTKPRFYSTILDHDGNVLIDNTPQQHQVVQETTAALLTNAMEDVITQGTGTTAQLYNMPVSGKTGTTTDNADIWLCAYTPYYTCSVWGGYDQNQSMLDTTWHMVLWRSIMQRLHENLEYREFEMPETCSQMAVCQITGKFAGGGCPVTMEWFADGTGPDGYCDGDHGDDDEEEEEEEEQEGEDDGDFGDGGYDDGGDHGGGGGSGDDGGSGDGGGGGGSGDGGIIFE